MLKPCHWGDRRRMCVGLLGGSFDPAHGGHLHVSNIAKRKLKLDQVWWLVTPQNPLKDNAPRKPLTVRIAEARAMHIPKWIHVSDMESAYGVKYTWQTVENLKIRFPRVSFVWLMGADNLLNFSHWSRWQYIFRSINIAVIDRHPFSRKSLFGKAAKRFSNTREVSSRACSLWNNKKPSWVFLADKKNFESSTQIKKKQILGDNKFLTN